MRYLLKAFDDALFVISPKGVYSVKAQETQEDNNNSGNCNFSCFK